MDSKQQNKFSSGKQNKKRKRGIDQSSSKEKGNMKDSAKRKKKKAKWNKRRKIEEPKVNNPSLNSNELRPNFANSREQLRNCAVNNNANQGMGNAEIFIAFDRLQQECHYLRSENERLHRALYNVRLAPPDQESYRPEVEVVFRNDNIARLYCREVQNFITGLLSQNGNPPASENNEQEELFAIDVGATSQFDSHESVPLYEAEAAEVLGDKNEVKSMGSSFSTPTSGRYHTQEKILNKFKPGVISDELREALELQPKQVPQYIYRMRILGYPPGWLEEATVKNDSLVLYDKDNCEEGQKEKEKHENEECVTYDPKKFIDFPGFNVPLSPDFVDEAHQMGYPPFQLGQLRVHMENALPLMNSGHEPTKDQNLQLKPSKKSHAPAAAASSTPKQEIRLDDDMEIACDSDEDDVKIVDEFITPLPSGVHVPLHPPLPLDVFPPMPPPLPPDVLPIPPPPPPPPDTDETGEVSVPPLIMKASPESLIHITLYSPSQTTPESLTKISPESPPEISPESPPEISPESPTNKISSESPTNKISPESPTNKISPESLTNKISPESLTNKISPESPTNKISPESPTNKISRESPPQEITPYSPTQESPNSPPQEISPESPPSISPESPPPTNVQFMEYFDTDALESECFARDSPSLIELEEQKRLLMMELNSSADDDDDNDGVTESTPLSEAAGSLNTSLSVSFGSPQLPSFSSCSKLPDIKKFSEGILGHLPFENLPDSTGAFEKLKNVLQKVRNQLNS